MSGISGGDTPRHHPAGDAFVEGGSSYPFQSSPNRVLVGVVAVGRPGAARRWRHRRRVNSRAAVRMTAVTSSSDFANESAERRRAGLGAERVGQNFLLVEGIRGDLHVERSASEAISAVRTHRLVS